MLSCESGDVEQWRALAKGADPDSRADCDGNFGPTGAPAAPEDDDLDPDVAAELKKANGRTCLLVALENGHPGVAFELLKAGASPSLADDADGMTPLMMAPKSLAVVKNSKLVDLLFAGTDVGVETPDGRNACSFAAAFGRDGYLRRLVAGDCSPEATRPGVASPLILAAMKDHGKHAQHGQGRPGLQGPRGQDGRHARAGRRPQEHPRDHRQGPRARGAGGEGPRGGPRLGG